VTFPVKGGPRQLELPAGSWTSHADDDVKFYSGTATYRKQITIPASLMAEGRRLYLDLGDVENLARVRLNGKDLGVLWKAPYVVDITAAVVAGPNRVELEVTNTWTNRLMGDAAKPEAERTTYVAAGRGGGRAGQGQAATPLPAGLLGPVRVVTEVKVASAG